MRAFAANVQLCARRTLNALRPHNAARPTGSTRRFDAFEDTLDGSYSRTGFEIRVCAAKATNIHVTCEHVTSD